MRDVERSSGFMIENVFSFYLIGFYELMPSGPGYSEGFTKPGNGVFIGKPHLDESLFLFHDTFCLPSHFALFVG